MSKKHAAQTVKPKPEPSRDNTREKHQPWKPGESGNLLGRPKGSRNKIEKDFLAELAADFAELDENGRKRGRTAIAEMRETKPADYVRAIVTLMPKELNVNQNPLGELTDDELEDAISLIRASLEAVAGPDGNGTDETTKH